MTYERSSQASAADRHTPLSSLFKLIQTLEIGTVAIQGSAVHCHCPHLLHSPPTTQRLYMKISYCGAIKNIIARCGRESLPSPDCSTLAPTQKVLVPFCTFFGLFAPRLRDKPWCQEGTWKAAVFVTPLRLTPFCLVTDAQFGFPPLKRPLNWVH